MSLLSRCINWGYKNCYPRWVPSVKLATSQTSIKPKSKILKQLSQARQCQVILNCWFKQGDTVYLPDTDWYTIQILYSSVEKNFYWGYEPAVHFKCSVAADTRSTKCSIKIWENFARLTVRLAKSRDWLNNFTINLNFSAIFCVSESPYTRGASWGCRGAPLWVFPMGMHLPCSKRA